MSHAVKIYRLLNILSIDVSAGAVVCALFFANIFDVIPGVPGLIALGFTVWIIYSTDHLLDVLRIETAATDRHQFYQRHFVVMIVITAAVTVADAAMIFFITPSILHAGLVLGAMVAVYLIAQRYFGFLKELLGAVLYTGGVILPAFVFSDDHAISRDQWMVVLCFLLIAWINLLVFSYFDKVSDEKQRQISFTTSMGEGKTRALVLTLFCISAGLCLALMLRSMQAPSVVLFVMSLVLVLLLRFREYFGRQDRYRYIGDAVFLFPLVLLLQ